MINKAEFDKLMAEKPSQRLANALIALDIFGNKPGCEVDMDFFYEYNAQTGTCFACLGGAATLVQLNVDEDAYKKICITGLVDNFCADADNKGFRNAVHGYELSLDDARQGNVGDMFSRMGLDYIDGTVLSREVAYHQERPRQWRKDMEQLVADLKEAGF